MLNQVIIVGRLIEKPEITKDENGTKKSIITLAVIRNFKNVDGIYDTDYIKCLLFGHMTESVYEYCNKGDLIGIRGTLRQGNEDKELQLIANNISFLCSGLKGEKNE